MEIGEQTHNSHSLISQIKNKIKILIFQQCPFSFYKINVAGTESYMIEKGSFVTEALSCILHSGMEKKKSQLRINSGFGVSF